MEDAILPFVGFHVSLIITALGFGLKYSERNRLYGIRTSYTLASDENWKYVHAKATKPTVIAGLAGIVVFASSYWIESLRSETAFWVVFAVQIGTLISTAFIRRPVEK
ncbi:MAG TPA: SdpI family protein [Bdellovibrionales bacterium]|nr:SdpI family protein [Bdellovibrionales bacterium]